jgi:hypothetical protein
MGWRAMHTAAFCTRALVVVLLQTLLGSDGSTARVPLGPVDGSQEGCHGLTAGACVIAPPSRRDGGQGSVHHRAAVPTKRRLYLRGGYQVTDRILQARMAAARSKVREGWYNATASDVFPWDGWEASLRDQQEGAPHVGFLGGTGRWLGPSVEQVRLVSMRPCASPSSGAVARVSSCSRRFSPSNSHALPCCMVSTGQTCAGNRR